MIDSKKIKFCFNKAANSYDDNCQTQKHIGIALIRIINNYNFNPKSIIDLGCGSGIVTEQLVRNFSNYKEFYALDIADQLIIKAQSKLINYNIKFLEYSFDDYLSADKFDLVFSNMALQWSKDLTCLLTKIHSQLSDQGLFAFSIPLSGTLAELNKNYVMNFYSLKDIQNMLKIENFQILNSYNINYSIKFNSKINALRSIKAVGASYYNNNKNTYLSELLKHRETLYHKFNLTYNIGFFISKKSK